MRSFTHNHPTLAVFGIRNNTQIPMTKTLRTAFRFASCLTVATVLTTPALAQQRDCSACREVCRRAEMFGRLDQDGNAVITFREFSRAQTPRLRKQFKQLDANGDGEVTRKEMFAATRKPKGDREQAKKDSGRDRKQAAKKREEQARKARDENRAEASAKKAQASMRAEIEQLRRALRTAERRLRDAEKRHETQRQKIEAERKSWKAKEEAAGTDERR